jgi:hypothetical protein
MRARNASPDILRFLVGKCPPKDNEAARKILRGALRSRQSLDMILIILDRYPDIVAIEFEDEATESNACWTNALHFAICLEAPLDITRVLIKRIPEALRKTDADGRIPLHLAYFTEASF